jgi:hypothetical protein
MDNLSFIETVGVDWADAVFTTSILIITSTPRRLNIFDFIEESFFEILNNPSMSPRECPASRVEGRFFLGWVSRQANQSIGFETTVRK